MILTRRLLLVLGLAGLLAAASGARAQISIVVGGSGARVEGSGNMVEEVRSVGPFSGLIVGGPIDVRLKAAAAERVVLHGDDNILPLIETRIEDGKLVVGTTTKASFRTRNKLYATVEFRELSSVLIRGSGDVVIDALESDAVALSIAGSGDFTASGRADKLGVVIIGSGDVRADKLEVREAAVRIRGSGDARVHAVQTLQVDIAGSGDVRYRGEPQVTKKVAGSGEVLRLR